MGLSVTTVLIYSLIGAVVLAYAPYVVTAIARVKMAKEMENSMEMFKKPRAYTESLPDYAKRANWAHQNGFEALIVYCASSLAAVATGVDSPLAIYAAIAFCVARALFSVFYIANIAPLRSMMFGVANLCNIVLFSLSVAAVQNL
ncbi:MAPEG family protein [[Limnothrix rosea] IAM M-220]|uniref:MAPEG family protein n=1 Tax=[Limnothrix rosea] IAM M-220 TaxID=454133 RepID=UPI0009595ED7|nr:MAPEG family protein [[Limnothrix rosea] IAM M-220]OKH16059.1 MAPEG family protein [[Limnothrix rosea] IAM M-220]